MIELYLDRLVAEFTNDAHLDEVTRAKLEYFQRTGEVHDDDECYEHRMASFVDWYLFDRRLPGNSHTPVMRFLADHVDELSKEEAEVFRGFADTRHSLFRVLKVADAGVRLYDLIDEEKVDVDRRRSIAGVMKGDIFEARLIPFEKRLHFSKGFCFHPREAEALILKRVKKSKRDGFPERNDLLHLLAFLRLRMERYRNVGWDRIYAEGLDSA